jgi:formate hydrogenlyase subunit 3/multisubunit Na+/H+ antiporter MnhD subunit
MTESYILLPIVIPFIAGLLVLLIGQQIRSVKEAIALLATAATLGISITLFKENINFVIPWTRFDIFDIDFALRLYHFSAFILVAASAFSFLFVLYSCSFMRDKLRLNQFYSYLLITLAMTNGAVLADNLVLMLFFWEGLLLTLFGMIAIGRPGAYKTAIKAFIIVGISDLCLMIGIGLAGYLSSTMTISKISLSVDSLGALAFILMMIGAISKAGSVPFHTWIPDAAVDAPLPFMAFLPASLEKLLGIYLLARISLDMFKLTTGSWLSILLMTIGAITILLAVMMALVQKDYKRLLSYHAVSQVGYMILGIGTCLPVGIIGGLFHMINHALYKSCLFLTGGAVEKQTGTTDLAKLGGIAMKMPVTFVCFVIAAASISGVPPFNGFFSKELVYDAALERGTIFYLAAILGTFLTAASFLKLGHAAFLGKRSEQNENVREAPFFTMLVPMIVIAAVCVVFGVWNYLPLDNLIKPILGEERLAGHEFGPNTMLITVTVIVLFGALLHHLFAAKINGGGYKASDHIRHAPFLEGTYTKAENRCFDPYDVGLKITQGVSRFGWWLDRTIDWLYEDFAVKIAAGITGLIRMAHTGSYSMYVIWSLIGVLFVVLMLIKSF